MFLAEGVGSASSMEAFAGDEGFLVPGSRTVAVRPPAGYISLGGYRRMSDDAHLRPQGEGEQPLYDTAVPTPTHGERARTLAAAIRTGTLCTLAKEPAGYPYGSFVTFAMDGASPVFF